MLQHHFDKIFIWIRDIVGSCCCAGDYDARKYTAIFFGVMVITEHDAEHVLV